MTWYHWVGIAQSGAGLRYRYNKRVLQRALEKNWPVGAFQEKIAYVSLDNSSLFNLPFYVT